MIPLSIYNASPPSPAVAGYFAPSQANVIAGTYTPFRWLWEVTPNTIPTTGPNLAEGVWIAYMKLDAGIITTAPYSTGSPNPNFVSDNNYMVMPRAAMAGGPVLNSALAGYTPLAGQTQTVPRLVVDANDFFYFTDAYIAYYAQPHLQPIRRHYSPRHNQRRKLLSIPKRIRLLLHNLRSNPLNSGPYIFFMIKNKSERRKKTMNLNFKNKKSIGAFALVFFMIASMFFAMGVVHAQGPPLAPLA